MTTAAQDTRTRRTIRKHGTTTGYQYKCRCEECIAAKLAYNDRRRRHIAYGKWQGRIDATGTRRRAQALLALGWTYTYQAERVGVHLNNYTKMLRAHATVFPRTAAAVAGLYEELSGTLAPDTWVSRRARQQAVDGRYPPPLAWDDDTIDDPAAQPQGVDFRERDKGPDWVLVERTCTGEPHLWADLCPDDKREVVARLLAPPYRWTQTQIGRYLHQSGSTIVKYLPPPVAPAVPAFDPAMLVEIEPGSMLAGRGRRRSRKDDEEAA